MQFMVRGTPGKNRCNFYAGVELINRAVINKSQIIFSKSIFHPGSEMYPVKAPHSTCMQFDILITMREYY